MAKKKATVIAKTDDVQEVEHNTPADQGNAPVIEQEIEEPPVMPAKNADKKKFGQMTPKYYVVKRIRLVDGKKDVSYITMTDVDYKRTVSEQSYQQDMSEREARTPRLELVKVSEHDTTTEAGEAIAGLR